MCLILPLTIREKNEAESSFTAQVLNDNNRLHCLLNHVQQLDNEDLMKT